MTHDDEQLPDIDAAADARVTEALDALGQVEPPDGFVGQILWRTSQRGRPETWTRHTHGPARGATMAKKVLVSLAAAAAILLAVVWYTGFPPSTGHTEGAIGAAQRYRTEQIKQSDVKVSNPDLQAFMQTDAFDRLIKDKQAVAALMNPAFQQLFALDGGHALSDAAVDHALSDSAIVAALAAPSVQQALAAPGFLQVVAAQGAAAAIGSAQFQSAVSDRNLYQALNSQAFLAALAAPGFQQALAAPGFLQALAAPGIQQALAAPGFQAALASPALQNALAAPGLQNVLASQSGALQLNQALAASGAAAAAPSGAAAEQH
jgi:hypothetical protein